MKKPSAKVVEAGEQTIAIYNALSEFLAAQKAPLFRKSGPVSLALLKLAGELAVVEGAPEAVFLHAARSCHREGRKVVDRVTADLVHQVATGKG